MLGIDMWDGTARQVDAVFRQGTNTTYPLLLEGRAVAREYGLDRENYLLVDHEGVIRYLSDWRSNPGKRFDQGAVRQAIAQALEAIPAPEPPPVSAVAPVSWGEVKSK
ncbi:MAG: hypothetical protein FJY95_20245 [Candidatus Handelsmanbacteria bacterium]|nr:hypothetical protein [Candidatus Handelsmanbacteria bacterium]